MKPGLYTGAPCPRRRHFAFTIQELLGHKDVRMTMIYAHVLAEDGKGVQSPVDAL